MACHVLQNRCVWEWAQTFQEHSTLLPSISICHNVSPHTNIGQQILMPDDLYLLIGHGWLVIWEENLGPPEREEGPTPPQPPTAPKIPTAGGLPLVLLPWAEWKLGKVPDQSCVGWIGATSKSTALPAANRHLTTICAHFYSPGMSVDISLCGAACFMDKALVSIDE